MNTAHSPSSARTGRPTAVRLLLTALLIVLLLSAPFRQSASAAEPNPTGTTPGTTVSEADVLGATVQPAMVRISIGWKAWVKDNVGWLNDGYPFRWSSSCSGFVVNPDGYIVTAGHCVDAGREGAGRTAVEQGAAWLIKDGWLKARNYDAIVDNGLMKWTVSGTTKGSRPDRTVRIRFGDADARVKDGKSLPARVIEVKKTSQGDVALLKVEQSDMATLPMLTETPAVGTEVSSVGFGQASDAGSDATFQPTFKSGQVSKIGTRNRGLLPVYEVSSPLSPGMSGGPTIDKEGDVIGVNSYTIKGEDRSFAFISPAELVRELLSRNGVKNELSPNDQLLRSSIADLRDGNHAAAVEALEKVAAAREDNEAVQSLLDKAEAGAELDAQRVAEEAAQRAAAAREAAERAAAERAAAERAAAQLAQQRTLLVAAGLLLAAAAAVGVAIARRRRGLGDGPAPQPPSDASGDTLPLPQMEVFAATQAPATANGTVPAANGSEAAGVAVLERTRTYCRGCGSLTGADARFCAQCGTPAG